MHASRRARRKLPTAKHLASRRRPRCKYVPSCPFQHSYSPLSYTYLAYSLIDKACILITAEKEIEFDPPSEKLLVDKYLAKQKKQKPVLISPEERKIGASRRLYRTSDSTWSTHGTVLVFRADNRVHRSDLCIRSNHIHPLLRSTSHWRISLEPTRIYLIQRVD